MFINITGKPVRGPDNGRSLEIDRETEQRFIDMTIVRLKGMGFGFRRIGRLLGLPKSTAHWRYHALPEWVREEYERKPLG